MSIARLHLRCDAKTGRHTLVVEYSSDLPRELHEEEHQRIRDRALDLLVGQGIDPDRVQVEYRRLPCPEKAVPPGQKTSPQPQPQPQPQPNSIREEPQG